MSNEREVEYEEKKAYHFKIENLDVYAIPLSERRSTEITVAGIRGMRETENKWGALIINDEEGLMPYEVWTEMRRRQVAQGLTNITGQQVHPTEITISGLSTNAVLKKKEDELA